MFRASIWSLVAFFYTKYAAFYIVMMFKNDNYYFLKINDIKTGEDVFFYLWLFLFLPTVFSFLLSAPLWFAFRLKSFLYFTIITILIFLIEYVMYTWLASQIDLVNGIINFIASISIYTLFFLKFISEEYKQSF
jgi:hypothetical protein